MARPLNRLTARSVATISKPGRHADGGGLYLSISKNGGRRWVFMFQREGRQREMGLGPARDVSLAVAREKAGAARRALAEGRDPLAEKRSATPIPFFGDFADALIDELAPGFRNDKHLAQWRMTMQTYAAPLRRLRVDEVSTDDVLAVLKPIWTTKPETASRVRGRIERVIDAARARGLRLGENPARWRGHLDHLLPKRQRLTRGHHAALPHSEIPQLLTDLRSSEGIASRALAFTILTAARSGETIGATWAEIDLEAEVWTVPAARMKAGREHRVPLSSSAMEIVREFLAGREKPDPAGLVFPGARRGTKLSQMALAMALRRRRPGFTVHGFRSSFRDWAGDATGFPREVAEAALAHAVGDGAERAYRRSDALEKRRKLMDAWDRYLNTPTTKVIALRRGAA